MVPQLRTSAQLPGWDLDLCLIPDPDLNADTAIAGNRPGQRNIIWDNA